MGISLDNSAFIIFLFPVFLICLVLSLFIFTYYQAKNIRNRPKVFEPETPDPEMRAKLNSELDEKYRSIPPEYLDQNLGIEWDRRSSSSTSSRCRSRSNSQVAVESMLRMLVSPDSINEEDDREDGICDMKFEEALSMFSGA